MPMAQEVFDSRRYFILLKQINMEQREMARLQERMMEQSAKLNGLILSCIKQNGTLSEFSDEIRQELESRRMLLAVLFSELDYKRDRLFMLHMELGAMEKKRKSTRGTAPLKDRYSVMTIKKRE